MTTGWRRHCGPVLPAPPRLVAPSQLFPTEKGARRTKPACGPASYFQRSRPMPVATTSPWVRRGRSSIHARGLFARCDIPAGTRVIEYVGHRITKRQAELVEQQRLERQRRGGDSSVYVFILNQRYDIDGGVPWNTARLANHSCEPNCEALNLRGHIWLVALRDIAAGEEITFDYGYEWEMHEEHPCRCGQPSCVGYILREDLRPRLRRRLRRQLRGAAASPGSPATNGHTPPAGLNPATNGSRPLRPPRA
jgi:hypothetical protein